jgi:hypothetical protein
MYSEGLGRLYDVVNPADDVYVNLKNCTGVTFIGFEVDGATVFTLTFAADSSGTGAVTTGTIDHYYGKSNDTASGVWHRTAVSPASNSFTAADATEDTVAIEVSAAIAPDGKYWVKCGADGSGTVTAILHDLYRQRAPQNLASVVA